MNISIVFRHLEPSDALRDHVNDKLEKFEKFFSGPVDIHVMLSVEKFRQKCEITLSAKDYRATALETSENLYSSIDMAAHKLDRQIIKHKEIIKDHKNVPTHTIAALAEELE